MDSGDKDGFTDIQSTIDRIRSSDNVIGVIVATSDGVPLQSSFGDETTTNNYCTVATESLRRMRHGVHELDPTDDLKFVRIYTRRKEILVTPERDMMMIVACELK